MHFIAMMQRHSVCRTAGSDSRLYFGEGVTEEQAAEVENLLHKENKEMEINVINGGQPVYYYIISVE